MDSHKPYQQLHNNWIWQDTRHQYSFIISYLKDSNITPLQENTEVSGNISKKKSKKANNKSIERVRKKKIYIYIRYIHVKTNNEKKNSLSLDVKE